VKLVDYVVQSLVPIVDENLVYQTLDDGVDVVTELSLRPISLSHRLLRSESPSTLLRDYEALVLFRTRLHQ
jgi:hypothetical protein